jgi:hypothetical protein
MSDAQQRRFHHVLVRVDRFPKAVGDRRPQRTRPGAPRSDDVAQIVAAEQASRVTVEKHLRAPEHGQRPTLPVIGCWCGSDIGVPYLCRAPAVDERRDRAYPLADRGRSQVVRLQLDGGEANLAGGQRS